ncbi:nucleotidyltransferase domain-containing protein [Candidatus Thiodictyon syntrophicum]|uniref:Nucleotidyltransferase n=1 Tax=Candidatus Thiodictyon syntrophicum TaxID=1166950 RepID=A0A2K8UBZ3_9GAMM|nr:nucleotidyltransferase domain-containing protein [Candidatus Thiodictyon syntrophicum]AUB83112.1 nucleotidyltransferase [Candidatus Thiodictyon syntrophicum]
MDTETERTARLFLKFVSNHYDLTGALLFGSRARHDGDSDSDADIAVLLRGVPGARADAAVAMAGIAFDVMLETGVLIDPIPLWEEEWNHPERFSNPALIANIRRDGVIL